MVHFGEFFKTWSLRSNSVTRQVTFNRTKIDGKCQTLKTPNATFWMIFKHCALCVFWPVPISPKPLDRIWRNFVCVKNTFKGWCKTKNKMFGFRFFFPKYILILVVWVNFDYIFDFLAKNVSLIPDFKILVAVKRSTLNEIFEFSRQKSDEKSLNNGVFWQYFWVTHYFLAP